MAYYQNIFTLAQVRPLEPEHGVPVSSDARVGKPFNSYLFGLIGNSQVGPIYIGYIAALSITCGLIAFEIIGLLHKGVVGANIHGKAAGSHDRHPTSDSPESNNAKRLACQLDAFQPAA